MNPPAISVVMPVFNGAGYLARAVASVRRQTFADWELLAVDDGSGDGSPEILAALAAEEPRLRLFRRERNGGPAAARNLALRHARGWLIAYLDCDDEYYPDYLAAVRRWAPGGDWFFFPYDLRDDRPDSPNPGRTWTWNPGAHRDSIATGRIAVPLGVAHRLGLLRRSGTFDESRWCESDMDLWRRMAAVGAAAVFAPTRSGLYHIRSDSQARTQRLPDELARA
jgi:glycosyltransferase involved in cell wall biosynthesis